jgi:hypothetical protein
VDLYNQAYWWECHEVLEALWHAAGRTSEPASFVHGVLHAAVAHLNRHRGKTDGARRQARKALNLLEPVVEDHPRYMGMDVASLVQDLRDRYLSGAERSASPILLHLPAGAERAREAVSGTGSRGAADSSALREPASPGEGMERDSPMR